MSPNAAELDDAYLVNHNLASLHPQAQNGTRPALRIYTFLPHLQSLICPRRAFAPAYTNSSVPSSTDSHHTSACNLDEPNSLIDTKEKPYVCDCGRSFARRDLLTRHERLSHSGQNVPPTEATGPTSERENCTLETTPPSAQHATTWSLDGGNQTSVLHEGQQSDRDAPFRRDDPDNDCVAAMQDLSSFLNTVGVDFDFEEFVHYDPIPSDFASDSSNCLPSLASSGTDGPPEAVSAMDTTGTPISSTTEARKADLAVNHGK